MVLRSAAKIASVLLLGLLVSACADYAYAPAPAYAYAPPPAYYYPYYPPGYAYTPYPAYYGPRSYTYFGFSYGGRGGGRHHHRW
jgi:hypothetical protein